MRKIFAALVLTLALPGLIALAPAKGFAAEYPEKTITWVVPFGAGGGTDRWARVLSSAAIDHFGQALHVRNMPGASGVVGWKKTLELPADGYTILQGSPTPVLSLLREQTPPLKPDDIKIAAYLSAFRAILMAQPGQPWSDWEGLVKYAKANPGKLTIGGTDSNLVGAANLLDQAGLSATLVPYPDTGKATADFLGGHVMTLAATTSTALTIVPEKATVVVNTSDLALDEKTAGKLGGPPSATDLGYKGISFPRWVGVHPDTPDEIADAISAKLANLVKDKAVVGLMKKLGEEVIFVPRKEAQAKYKNMVNAMRKAVELLK